MFEDFRIRIFMEVASEGSFTKAAKNIGISQPAVSQNISELEKTLGVTLFERMRGEVTLTDAGKTFKDYAENILHWYHAAGNVFSGTNKAAESLNIVSHPFISSYLLPDVISAVRSGGDYRFDVRQVAKGDENVTLSLKRRTQTIDFEGANTLVGTIQASMVVSAETKELLDKKRKYLDSIPIAVWSEYEPYLPLDLKSRVVIKSDSIESLRSMVIESSSVMGILPHHTNVIKDMIVIPHPLPHLQMDVHLAFEDETVSKTHVGKQFKLSFDNCL